MASQMTPAPAIGMTERPIRIQLSRAKGWRTPMRDQTRRRLIVAAALATAAGMLCALVVWVGEMMGFAR
jgi:hypothetical protein